MTNKEWLDLRDGYGLEEVPKTLGLVCHLCGEPNLREKVYTNGPLPSSSNFIQYSKEKEDLRTKTFCRFHAEWWFKDKS